MDAAARLRSAAAWFVRHLPRIAIVSCAVLVLLYVAVPWLLPGSWITARLASRLSARLGRDVQIARTEFDYGQGLQLEGLVIGRRSGYGDAPFFTAGKVCTPLGRSMLARPGRLLAFLSGLFGDPLEQLRVERPACWVVVGADGTLNIEDLDDPGVLHLPATSLEIRQFELHFLDLRDSPADSTAAQGVRLPYLKFAVDPRTGRFDWDAGTATNAVPQHSQDEDVAITGELSTPRLRDDVLLGGGGSITWKNLDLSQMPTMLVPVRGVQTIAGHSHGVLDVQVAADLKILFDARVQIDDAAVRLVDDRVVELFDDIQARVAGSWAPEHERLEISTLRCEAPQAMVLEGPGGGRPVVAYDPHNASASFAIRGHVESLGALRELMDVATGGVLQGIRRDGACALAIELSRKQGMRFARVDVDATQAAIAGSDGWALPRGEVKGLSMSAARRPGGEWLVRDAALTVSGSRLSASGEWPVPDWSAPITHIARRCAQHGRGRLEFESRDLAGLFERLPFLKQRLPGLRASGGLTAKQHIEAVEGGVALRGTLRLEPPAEVSVGEHFRKPPGRPLSIDYAAWCPPGQHGVLRGVSIDCRYGPARLATVGDRATLSLRSEVPDSQWDREKLRRGVDELTASGAVVVTAVEDGLALFPRANAWLAKRYASTAPLAGDLSADVQLRAMVVNDQPVLRFHTLIDAHRLDVELGEDFVKPRAAPCLLEFDYTHDDRARPGHRLAGMRGQVDGGALESLIEWSHRPDSRPGGGYRDLNMELQVEDWSRLASHWPALRKQAGTQVFSGGGRIEVNSLERDGEGRWWGDVDLTRTGIAAPAEGPPLKSPGTTCRIGFRGRTERPLDESMPTTLTFEEFACSVGSSQVRLDRLVASFDGPQRGPGPAGEQRTSPAGALPTLRELDMLASAKLVLDEPWPPWADALRLRGEGSAQLELRYHEQRWSAACTVEGTALDIDVEPALSKRAGTPLSIAVSAESHASGQQDAARVIELSDARLQVGRSVARASGRVRWPSGRGSLDGPRSGHIRAAFELEDLSELQPMWSAWHRHDMQGRLHLQAEVSAVENEWVFRSVRAAPDGVRVATPDIELTADGLLRYDEGAWQGDALALGLGTLQCVVSGGGRLADGGDPLEFSVRCDELSKQQLIDELRGAVDAIPDDLSAVLRQGSGSGDPLAWLLEHHFSAGVHVGKVQWPDPQRPTLHTLDEVVGRLDWNAGEVNWEMRAAYNGGLLQVRLAGPLEDYDLGVALNNAMPSAEVETQLRCAFPGLQPSGEIDYTYDTVSRSEDDAGAEVDLVASGELTVRGGALHGKAAPGWITRLFPKLNLASFSFQRMHDWYKVYADGRVRHQAIFQGQHYHLYADGWENVGGRLDYEIGLDMLAGLDSRFWVTSESGRIPLFRNTTTLGHDGQVLAESVSYVPLQLVKAILWDNNPINTAYLALRKRIQDEQPGQRSDLDGS